MHAPSVNHSRPRRTSVSQSWKVTGHFFRLAFCAMLHEEHERFEKGIAQADRRVRRLAHRGDHRVHSAQYLHETLGLPPSLARKTAHSVSTSKRSTFRTSQMTNSYRIASEEVVEIFLHFFESRDHLRISGNSLLPKNDPTLLFTNSGMAPLKRYFLGLEEPPHHNLVNIQSCVRTTDISDVGDRHEMMGSWSIGSYWKKRAIDLAFELLTQHFAIPTEKLYATVYSGDQALGIPPDTESREHWIRVGLEEGQIVPLREENFWGPAGTFGPCGPCTEVFFDTGDEYGLKVQTWRYF